MSITIKPSPAKPGVTFCPPRLRRRAIRERNRPKIRKRHQPAIVPLRITALKVLDDPLGVRLAQHPVSNIRERLRGALAGGQVLEQRGPGRGRRRGNRHAHDVAGGEREAGRREVVRVVRVPLVPGVVRGLPVALDVPVDAGLQYRGGTGVPVDADPLCEGGAWSARIENL